ncbi:MAG TPA: cytochrome C oxidase subunit IV family protein [Tepidisphaeraceae bacterium]|nr:cytochrome C oxidase subunit IV family protein [Tepidisphaeraceae bacterium]
MAAPHSQHPQVIGYHAPGTPDVPEEHSSTKHVSVATYLVIFAALMVLLVLTVGAAFWFNLGRLNILVALAIATVKAALVVLFFMHVMYASRLTKIFVAAAFLWLIILFGLTFGDYATREWSPVSRGWVENPATAGGSGGR